MAIWGIETWNEQGKTNNLGLKPFMYSEVIALALNQTGSWAIPLVPGTKAGYIFIPSDSSNLPEQNAQNRKITASAGTITVGTISGSQIGAETNSAGYLYIFMVAA